MGGHRRAALLGQPLFTGAVALLAVNDAILKPTFGTWWTGKLSDAAGVVVLTIVLAVATGHAGLGGILAAAALTAIKVYPTAAEQAETIIGGETRQDATDLFALVLIAPVVRHVRARLIDGSPRPVDGRVFSAAAGLVAIFAISATSCADPSVNALIVDGSTVYAATGELKRVERWAVSRDGGLTWAAAPPRASAASLERETCADTIGCFRIVDAQRIEQRAPGGTWRKSFLFTTEQQRRLRLRNATCGDDGVPDLEGVVIAPSGDGDHVVVGAAEQGVLHRDPDGQWTRRAVLDCKPVSLAAPSWLSALNRAPLVLAALSLVVLAVGLIRRRTDRGALGFGVALGGAWAGWGLFGLFGFWGVDYRISGPTLAGLCAGVFVVSVWLAVRPSRKRGHHRSGTSVGLPPLRPPSAPP